MRATVGISKRWTTTRSRLLRVGGMVAVGGFLECCAHKSLRFNDSHRISTPVTVPTHPVERWPAGGWSPRVRGVGEIFSLFGRMEGCGRLFTDIEARVRIKFLGCKQASTSFHHSRNESVSTVVPSAEIGFSRGNSIWLWSTEILRYHMPSDRFFSNPRRLRSA